MLIYFVEIRIFHMKLSLQQQIKIKWQIMHIKDKSKERKEHF